MKTKHAGERKRTVTVIVGPETLVLLDKVHVGLEKRIPGERWSYTDLVGMALNFGLADLRRKLVSEDGPDSEDHFA